MSKIKITEEMKNQINEMLINGLTHEQILEFTNKYDSKKFLTENEIQRARTAYRQKRNIIIQTAECDNLDRTQITRVIHNSRMFDSEDKFVNAILDIYGYDYYFVE